MFTFVETAVGALLLHRATTALLFNNGSILGISGLLRQLLNTRSLVPVLFFFGMALSYVVMNLVSPEVLPDYPTVQWNQRSILIIFGTSLLVGWGTKGCGGCTSGHMLCGTSRFSPRSFLATGIFFTAAVITFHLTNPSLSTSVCPSDAPCYHPAPSLLLKSKSLFLLLCLSALGLETIPLILSVYASKKAASKITYLLTGYTFGLGLLVSGMATPAKVQAFFAFSLFPFDITRWDPSLTLVVIFGILPNMAQIQWRRFARPPKFANVFSLPTKTMSDVDAKFVLGAAAFGVAWGATGVCPGPAVLRAVGQPLWGLLWLSGFWIGGLLG